MFNFGQHSVQLMFVRGKNNEIVHVSEVIFSLEMMFDKQVQLVEIEIGSPLADQVADGEIAAFRIVMIADREYDGVK